MALANLTKINIIGDKKHQTAVLEKLQQLGVVQIDPHFDQSLESQKLIDQIADTDYALAGVNFSIQFLSEFDTAKKSLQEKINPKAELSVTEIETRMKHFDHKQVTAEVQEIEAKINEAKSIITKAEGEIAQLESWKALTFDLTLSEQSRYDILLGVIPAEVSDELQTKLNSELPLSTIHKLGEEKKEIRAVFVYKKEERSTLTQLLDEYKIKIVELPITEGKIGTTLSTAQQEILKAQKDLTAYEAGATKLTKHLPDLKIAADYLGWQKDLQETQQEARLTSYTFSVVGWADKSKLAAIQNELEKITPAITITSAPIDEEETIPVQFKNTWAAPFEAVTNVYGAPLADEPDPTPFLTPFYILFFGLCLTDAGYGIILALMSFLGLKILKPAGETAKMFKVMMYGGIVTFLAGAAVGGWFGIVIDEIQNEGVRNFFTSMRLIDPVQNPIGMLIFSLILGVIQMMAGLLVSMWWKIKNNKVTSAILDDGLWLYFITIILVWAADKQGMINFAASKYLLWAGIIGLIVTQGRDKKNPILKLTSGILSLYGVVGYLSDVLSYSRLLALGLATGIIAMVINLIAGLAIEMVPYLGYVIALLILVGGHIFNIGINALGAFIHSSRLQFVEFFPKFMEGGGKVFAPFRKETKYVKVTK